MSVRLAVIFYSSYGTNHGMAEVAAEAAREAGAEVRFRRVAETAPKEAIESQDGWKAEVEKAASIPVATSDDMEWANAYLFSAPTRFGGMPAQLRAFTDSLGPLWFGGKLANKAVSAMTSAQSTHGGQEGTLLTFYNMVMHWGSIIVAPGYTDEAIMKAGGNPYGYSHTQGPMTEEGRVAIRHQAQRLVDFAGRIAG